MNLTGLISAVRTRIGVPATDAFHTDARVTTQINSALQYISSLADFEWLEFSENLSTANGIQLYPVGSSVMRTVSLVDNSGIPLQRRTLTDIEFMGLATANYVRFYAQQGNQLMVFPIPNMVLNLRHRYIGSEAGLVLGTDVPVMRTQWHEALVAYSAYLCENMAGASAEAEAHKQVFTDFLPRMLTRSDRRADSTGGGQDAPPPPTPSPPPASAQPG